jgi:hypothetical protein
MSANNRYEELREAFARYHEKNPDVLDLFVKFTFELIDAGHERGSTAMIIERIRWETKVNPEYKNRDEFKISNNHKPFYARAFRILHKEHKDFFKVNKMFSKDRPATGNEMKPSMVQPDPDDGEIT